jgi:hypothetical protein
MPRHGALWLESSPEVPVNHKTRLEINTSFHNLLSTPAVARKCYRDVFSNYLLQCRKI